jgi:predicted metal-dependent peptidase
MSDIIIHRDKARKLKPVGEGTGQGTSKFEGSKPKIERSHVQGDTHIYDNSNHQHDIIDVSKYTKNPVYRTNPKTEEQKNKTRKNRKETTEQARSAGGDGENGPEQALDKDLDWQQAGMNWEIILKRFLENSANTTYNYTRRHRKSNAIGTFMPGMSEEENKFTGVIAIDTSASMREAVLRTIRNQILTIIKNFKDLDVYIAFFTNKVYKYTHLRIPEKSFQQIKTELESITISPGGTKINPVSLFVNQDLKQLEKAKVDNLLIFTDGWIEEQTGTLIRPKIQGQTVVLLHGDSTDEYLKGRYTNNIFKVDIKYTY